MVMKDRHAVRASVSDIALVLFSSLTGSPAATVCVQKIFLTG